MRRTCAKIISALALVAMAGSGNAHAEDLTDRMLASVVFIECDLEFQGEFVEGGSGSGFLLPGLDRIVTNNHVVTECVPDNKIAAVYKFLLPKMYETVVGEITKDGKIPAQFQAELDAGGQPMADRIKSDATYRATIIKNAAIREAKQRSMTASKTLAPNVVQKLYVTVLGKASKQPLNFPVSSILWNSENSNEKAWQTGVDLAIVKLDRPVPDGAAVTFATGESARVNDTVYSVGFPGASGDMVSSNKYVPTMKRGIVSKLGGESPFATREALAKGLKGAPVIETDAAINHGNSGGPLFNEYGEVLGINTFTNKDNAAGVGWAQDVAVVIPVLQDIGIPAPHIRTTPPGFIDKNPGLAWGGAGGVAVVLLGSLGVLMLRKPVAKTETGGGGSGSGAKPVGTAATLVGREGQFSGVSIPIPKRGLELGRGNPGDGRLAFAESSDVSRHHAIVVYDEGARRFRVTDLGSANGTLSLPSGDKLTSKQEVEFRPGQMIKLGNANVFELKAN